MLPSVIFGNHHRLHPDDAIFVARGCCLIPRRTEGDRQPRATHRPAAHSLRKIATFNINNVNRRLANLLNWLRAAMPDVVCLRELRADNAAFPRGTLLDAGYDAVCAGNEPGTGWPFWPATRNRS
jgi:hypothetical protein